MKAELDKQLCESYPKIFKNRYADMRTTAMCWGFECDEGWYNIIRALCGNIQGHIDWSRKQRLNALRFNRALKRAVAGNRDSLIKYFSYSGKVTDYTLQQVEHAVNDGRYRAVPEATPQVVAEQVKEKFGTLRFYYRGGDNYISGLVAMAESMSGLTCEVCGNPGKINGGGWLRALCATHTGKDDLTENT